MAHVVHVNASKSNVLMVQAWEFVHFIQKSISRIFSQAFCLFKIRFSLIILLKKPDVGTKKPFPDSKPKLEKQKAKTRRKPTIPAIPNLCFCATCTMYKSCWNPSPRTNLQILELAREPQTQNLRCQVPGTWGAHAKTPRVPWLRNYHFLMGKFPKKKPRWKPGRNWRRKKTRTIRSPEAWARHLCLSN